VPPPNIGNGKIKAIIFDKKGITRFEFKNYIFLDRPTIGVSGSEDSQACFYRYKGKLYFKEEMNDTLFCLTDSFKLCPIASFNIGKYSKPKKYRNMVMERGSGPPEGYNPANYIYLRNVFKISNFLLLDCNFGFHTPARRITPKEIMGKQLWYNTQSVLGFYSKENMSLVFCKPTSTDNPLFTTGFYNDIDAGPRFYPFKQVNDSTMVMWIEAKNFKEHIASDDFKNNIPKYPEKKKQLEELTKSISEFDNPVLMFVTFKNK
jgi:hypothetical protein